MRSDDPESVRKVVRDRYALAALSASSCCGSGCQPEQVGREIGYCDSEMSAVPEGANLGLGCGNPTALAALEPGQVVLDLGSGAGLDVFLAAEKVGPSGKVIGVDMTEAMLVKARENARSGGFENVQFRKGTIEALPVEDASVDVIISNCVINLSPEKERVFAEAFRVLRPGGRIMVSDIVLEKPLPPAIRDSVLAYVGCVAGASLRDDYLSIIERAGFTDLRILNQVPLGDCFSLGDPLVQEGRKSLQLNEAEVRDLLSSVTSLGLSALKP
ncbi:MAG: arsenite methyltransferase [Deltaproteobacteria bacterium]|nr:arsenite methyltransferase [Deltaproteobacteria bacterium]